MNYPSVLVAVVLLAYASSKLAAATYYVDYSSGSDANGGTSTSTPWKHCPGDSRATGNAAGKALSAGDTVIFKGGVSYTGTVSINWSGGSGNPIIYDGNSAGTWGPGKAVFNGQNNMAYATSFVTSTARNNYTIKNFVFTELGGYNPIPPPSPQIDASRQGQAIDISYGGSGIIIQDCLFTEIGEWHNTQPFSANAIQGFGIWLQDTTGSLIQNCEFTKVFCGIALKAFSGNQMNAEVSNCNFHNYIGWSIDISPRSAGRTLSGIKVHDCIFHDYLEYTSGLWSGYGPVAHVDNIFMRVDFGLTTWSNNQLYNNLFYVSQPIGNGGTACMHITEGPTVDIFNNVFMNTVHGRTIFLNGGAYDSPASPQTVNIVNNTFYNDHTAISILKNWNRTVAIRNNVFFDTRDGSGGATIIYDEDGTAGPFWTVDYNLYSTANQVYLQGGAYHSFTQFQAAGYEAHGIVGDPKFTDIDFGLGPDVAQNDLRLQAGSPVIGTGTPLNSYFILDRVGTVRGNSWDMGAFEFGGASQSPFQAPRNLRIIGGL